MVIFDFVLFIVRFQMEWTIFYYLNWVQSETPLLTRQYRTPTHSSDTPIRPILMHTFWSIADRTPSDSPEKSPTELTFYKCNHIENPLSLQFAPINKCKMIYCTLKFCWRIICFSTAFFLFVFFSLVGILVGSRIIWPMFRSGLNPIHTLFCYVP